MSYDLKVLEQGCEELGIALNDTQKQQFIAFYEYLGLKRVEKYGCCAFIR